jgi:NAD+ diphosphatase
MRPFISSITPPTESTEPAYWFIFRGYRLLIYEADEAVQIPSLTDISALDLPILRQQYLGYLPGEKAIHCYAAEVAEEIEATAGMAFVGLRSLYGRLSDELFWLGGRAVQIADWDRTHQFCGRCGSPTEDHPQERSKRCPQCGLTQYPRLAPAIIVAVTREGENGRHELLLARGPRHRPGFYSILAGFVEPGESLEACVAREVKEEVGIDLQNIRYFGSQPWPFPHSLMLGFTAEYAGGDFVLQEDEIEEAGWYTADNLPNVPPPLSISRQLIDDFVTRSQSDS